MNIEGISPVNASLSRVQEAAAVKVTSMALSNQKQQMQDMAKLLNSAQVITDPALGNRVNILA
jgi:hypothetical protein